GLTYRVLDAWGAPRATGDPQLRAGSLRLLRAIAPESAQMVSHAMSRAMPLPPSAATAYELSIACSVAAPPGLPETLLLAEPVPPSEVAYDPKRSTVFKQPANGKLGPGQADGVWS